MGLSDGERYRNIAHIISELSTLPRFEEYGHGSLNPILDRLWFDFLGRSSNGLHWLRGSASGASHLDECSLLGVEFKAALVKYESPEHRTTPIYWAMEYKPDADHLLESGSENARIWRIVRLIESYFYSANRYEDEFSAGLEMVTRSICELRGKCFSVLKSNPIFAVAWMMQAIIDRCFPYDDDDLLTSCGAAFNWQHCLRASGQDPQEVRRIFKRYQFADITTHGRLCVILQWAGRRFHYEHQHHDLVERIRAWNQELPIMEDLKRQHLTADEIAVEISEDPDSFRALGWVDEVEVSALCAANKTAHDEEEKQQRDNYAPYCSFTGQSKDYPSRDDD